MQYPSSNETALPLKPSEESVASYQAPPVLGQSSHYVAKWLEAFSARHRHLARSYGCILYKKLVMREMKEANIEPGMRVLHIGCGALPLTAIYLARNGCHVTALDHDATCVEAAGHLIESEHLSGRIECTTLDGQYAEIEGYDAVWISVQVRPKEDIIKRVLSQLKPGATVVYRNPRSWSRLLYAKEMVVKPHHLHSAGVCVTTLKQLIAKESVIIKRPPRTHIMDATDERRVEPLQSLEEMDVGSQGKLAQLPEHPLLAPLGLRRGKLISIQSKQRFGGPVMVETQGRVLAIARCLAKHVFIEGGVVGAKVP